MYTIPHDERVYVESHARRSTSSKEFAFGQMRRSLLLGEIITGKSRSKHSQRQSGRCIVFLAQTVVLELYSALLLKRSMGNDCGKEIATSHFF